MELDPQIEEFNNGSESKKGIAMGLGVPVLGCATTWLGAKGVETFTNTDFETMEEVFISLNGGLIASLVASIVIMKSILREQKSDS